MWSVVRCCSWAGSAQGTPATFDILDNKEVIAVDQDPLGKQGTVLSSEGGRWVDRRGDEGRQPDGGAVQRDRQRPAHRHDHGGRGAAAAHGYTLRDLWQHRSYNTARSRLRDRPAHGTVLVRVSANRHWAENPPPSKWAWTEARWWSTARSP